MLPNKTKGKAIRQLSSLTFLLRVIWFWSSLFILWMLFALVLQIHWGLVLCQMFLRFEDLQYSFLFLAPVCVLFIRDIPSMLSQAIPVWGLQQISKFVEVQKIKIIIKKEMNCRKRMYVCFIFVCVFRRLVMLIFTPPVLNFKHLCPLAFFAYFLEPLFPSVWTS